MKGKIIVISGLSGTGKTTIGKYLSEKLSIPFFNKDNLKEIMFDEIGWKDRGWSQKLGAASYKILYMVAEEMTKNGKEIILESNFRTKIDGKKLKKLKEKYSCEMIEILCHASGNILFERFKKRAESGERHPGHVDHLSYKEQEARLLKGRAGPLGVGRLIEIDTSDWSKVNLEEVVLGVK